MTAPGAVIRVTVRDHRGRVLSDARVTIRKKAKGARARAMRFDQKQGVFVAKDVEPGKYQITAKHEGFTTEEQPITVGRGGAYEESFRLGRPDQTFYYRGRERMPFKRDERLVGVSLIPGAGKDEEKTLKEAAAEMELVEQKLDKEVLVEGIRLFKLKGRDAGKRAPEVLRRITGLPVVRHAGPVVESAKDNVAFMTNQLIVRFRQEVTAEAADALAKEHGLTQVRRIGYAGNAALYRVDDMPDYGILDLCEALVKTGQVEYAEPNLVVSAVDDQVNPTDFLYGQQWHSTLIDLPEAWQILRNANPAGVTPGDAGDITFGSPDIVIAVMDRGIQSQTVAGATTSRHPDFDGTVTTGDNKVLLWYDFDNMVANNDNPPNNHGMGCAGVAAALADNASVVPDENEGVAGAAPNCRVMGLIRPAGGTTQQYADAYVWMAGFDPGWVADGVNYPMGTAFPAVPTQGADVITNSYDIPSGGLMQDTFDFLTTFGRGGKGIPLFCSAGNGNTTVATARPMAAYEKTVGVAASTDGEVRAWYSNFGPEISICAPSSGGTAGITTCDLVGGGNIAGHTGGGNDYRDNFGGTSSATPLAAGVAALMLSANPDLTWVQVRGLLQETAIQIDAANTDATGQWTDTDGDGVNDFSQWYGYGRIEADAAVQAALDLVGVAHLDHIDTWIKENTGDVGDVPSLPPYSPDVWVRNADPATDNPADVETHQAPIRGQDNWVYARVRNRGAVDSRELYVRISITRWAGTQYVYPEDFIPTVPPNTTPVTPMAPGTYLIGEVKVDSIPAGGDVIVNTPWPSGLIPPAEVVIDGVTYSWADSCLLVEVSPHDGPTTTGNHTWDNNNLCQRNITIVDADDADTDDLTAAFVVGHRFTQDRFVRLLVRRGPLPPEVKLLVDPIDRRMGEWLAREAEAKRAHPAAKADVDKEYVLLDDVPGRALNDDCGKRLLRRDALVRLAQAPQRCAADEGRPVKVDGRWHVALPFQRTAIIRLPQDPHQYKVLGLRFQGLKSLPKGEFPVTVSEEDEDGRMLGRLDFLIRKG